MGTFYSNCSSRDVNLETFERGQWWEQTRMVNHVCTSCNLKRTPFRTCLWVMPTHRHPHIQYNWCVHVLANKSLTHSQTHTHQHRCNCWGWWGWTRYMHDTFLACVYVRADTVNNVFERTDILSWPNLKRQGPTTSDAMRGEWKKHIDVGRQWVHFQD